ncbi:hypothetical protein IV73_GL000441 [Weissella kandleri]|uniref:Oligoendopeptidase F n=1 Tax=Weissella kandleri TaxID=1616 RepID=A0A0R2JD77_9LACO|nr:M3 family oligoendopeptidase [Weissella kandleri]KRN75279.1 hypothetical protein IV73_GL000441 [Weissella kandleri]
MYQLNWDLDSIYQGGVNGADFQQHLAEFKEMLQQFTQTMQALADRALDENIFPAVTQALDAYQTLLSRQLTLDLFVNAWAADNYGNPIYRPIQVQLEQLAAQLTEPEQILQRLLGSMPEPVFQVFVEEPAIGPIKFAVQEMRSAAQRLLAPATEQLFNQMQLDGLSAWSSHYETLVGGLTLTYVDEFNQERTISAGQAVNEIDGYPDAKVRAHIMQAYEQMWAQVEDLAADTLNHLAGARLTEQHAHHEMDFLTEPLRLNRMSKAALDMMWQVVEEHQTMFKPYFKRRAELLGVTELGWQDQTAPLGALGNYQAQKMSYDETAQLIIENFAKYSPKMAQFAQNAFEKQWIEAQNRPGKQPGGWMESVPDLQESRIFLTFTGSPNDAATIAHELGHGFHTEVLKDLPYLRNNYAMNVAETASTFAELVVNDANVQNAQSDAERVALLDAKLANPVAMFMNINARYRFERQFYQERQAGYVPASRLNEMMEAAQKAAFQGVLTTWHPHFWASKLHFYADDVPFYNFPYTFGYLFSLGIYTWAKQQPNFEAAYIELLQDTAAMTTEELALKHLHVDLTQPDFWEQGVKAIQADLDEYLTLSAQFVK